MAKKAKQRLHRLSSIFWTGSLLFGAAFAKFVISDGNNSEDGDFSFQMKLFSGCMGVMLLILAILCRDLADRSPAESHSLSSLFTQYLVIVVGSNLGKFLCGRFQRSTKYAASSQEKFLLKLLKTNATTDYGRAHGFNKIKSVEEFRKKHPVTTYASIEPYIKKICSSNRNALTKSDPMCMARTSGTTGKFKKIPISGDSQKAFLKLVPIMMNMPNMKGIQQNLQKQFSFSCQPEVESTASGLKVAPFSYFFYYHTPFMVAPKAACEITNERSAYYIHGLFALAEHDIGSFMIGFSHQCYAFFLFLEKNLQSLCDDLAQGTISDGLAIDEGLYETLRDAVKPDQARATEVRNAFQKGKVGLAKRLWPDLTYCRTVSTGSMAVYKRYLLETYMKDVEFVSTIFGGSEGVYGLSLTSDSTLQGYTLAHQLGFFEFLPEQYLAESDVKDKLVLAHLTEPGNKYELVITNENGLYRYRTGDVVLVTSMYNQCPVMEVLYRTGQTLNVMGERTTEDMIYKALVKATDDMGCYLIDYTVSEDVYVYGMDALKEMTRKYVLFVETSKKLNSQDKSKFDSALCTISEPYFAERTTKKMMSGMEVIQVKRDTFLLLKEHITQGVANPQFKIPRALRVREHLDFLLKNKW